MKSFRLAAFVALLGIVSFNIHAQTAINSIANQLNGRWYLTKISGGVQGVNTPVIPVAGDSIIFTRIPSTDSITWEVFHNCELEDKISYALTYGQSELTGQWTWFLKRDLVIPYFSVTFLNEETLIIMEELIDGFTYRYSRIDTFTVHGPPVITGTTDGSRCGPGEITLCATTAAGIVNWYTVPTGGSPIATGNTFVTPSLDTTTIYYVDATYDGCIIPTRATLTATISNHDSCQASSISPSFAEKVIFYPNPTSGKFEIRIDESCKIEEYAEVIDNLGSMIHKEPIDQNGFTLKIDLTKYPAGIYFIIIHTSEGNCPFKVIRE